MTGKGRATLSLLKGQDFTGWHNIIRLVDEPTRTQYYAKPNPMVKPSAIRGITRAQCTAYVNITALILPLKYFKKTKN
jgi:hypothetical protein